MVKIREDERFKAVGPDNMVITYHPTALQSVVTKSATAEEAEIWFDWTFVDFWKSNYYTIQRGFAVEPDQLSSTGGMYWVSQWHSSDQSFGQGKAPKHKC
jgi:hypothetical protein